MKQVEPLQALERAYVLQETIKKERQQLRQHEEEYKLLMMQISAFEVKKVEYYEVVQKVLKRRYIDSGKFRSRWPDLFDKLAKVTIKDAEAEIQSKDLESVCEVREILRQEIVSYKKPPA